MSQPAADFLAHRIAELQTDLSLEIAERDKLRNERNILANEHPTYVPKPSPFSLDSLNGREDKGYTKQLDDIKAKYDAEISPHVQDGEKDGKGVMSTLEQKRAEIRDVREEIGRLEHVVALFELLG